MKLLGISGSLSQNSKTELTIRHALEFAKQADGSIETELIALSEFELVFCDGRNPDDYEGDSRTVIDKITGADAFIVGSPIYRGTYSGALKNLFDLIPNDALKGKVVGIVATGGSDHHFLAIEHQFKPIFGFFNAHVIPGGVYANNSHFSDGKLVAEDILKRLEKLGEETARLAGKLNQDYSGPSQLDIERKPLNPS